MEKHQSTVTYQDHQVAVLDDFLGAAEWAAVLARLDAVKCRTDDIAHQHSRVWSWTGQPPTSSPVHFHGEQANWTTPLLHCFLQAAKHFRERLQLRPWDTIRAYLQLAVTGIKLRWHVDDGACASLTWYAHRRWEPGWGGEVHIAPERLPGPPPKGNCFASDYLPGRQTNVGMYLEPLPNRLLVVAPGVLHEVTRIDPDAGAAVRIAVVALLLPGRGEGKGPME